MQPQVDFEILNAAQKEEHDQENLESAAVNSLASKLSMMAEETTIEAKAAECAPVRVKKATGGRKIMGSLFRKSKPLSA